MTDLTIGRHTILIGDVRERLRDLPDESVHCVVTSPPYFGLRDYGTAKWEGGDPACNHRHETKHQRQGDTSQRNGRANVGHTCGRCGATRVDNQIGLEPTLAEFIATMVDVFREVRRVLRDDGTLWLNVGDSYASSGVIDRRTDRTTGDGGPLPQQGRAPVTDGLKPKDLMMVPARLAIALQEPYCTGAVKRPEDRAWLAAMIDSDGALGIRIQHPREGRGTNETYIPYIAISQTDTGCLEHAARITGMGRVNVKHEPNEDGRGIVSRRTMYTWRLDGQQASKVIRDIYPYLIVKRAQAQIVYAMNESLRWGRPTRSLPVPPKVMEERRRLYECIKRLNQREPVDLPKLPDVPDATEPGWYLRSSIIWHKKAPMPESVTDRPTSAHEHIFLLAKNARYYYDSAAVAEPVADSSIERLSQPTLAQQQGSYRANGGTKTNGTMKALGSTTTRNLRNVWTLSPEAFSEAHFATFPTEIPRRAIKAGCPEGGTVLDPFLGSGTTMLVADQLGRTCIGVELNPEYARMAEKRVRSDAPLLLGVA